MFIVNLKLSEGTQERCRFTYLACLEWLLTRRIIIGDLVFEHRDITVVIDAKEERDGVPLFSGQVGYPVNG